MSEIEYNNYADERQYQRPHRCVSYKKRYILLVVIVVAVLVILWCLYMEYGDGLFGDGLFGCTNYKQNDVLELSNFSVDNDEFLRQYMKSCNLNGCPNDTQSLYFLNL